MLSLLVSVQGYEVLTHFLMANFSVLIIVCILVDMLGLMVLWNIDLNAISVANLVMVC